MYMYILLYVANHEICWTQVKKEWRQVNEKIQKGHIGIVEKVQETSSDTGVHNGAITVRHEQ